MSVFDKDIDKEIQQHQQKILELEALKKAQEKKLVAIQEFNEYVTRLCNQNELTENELFVARAEQIEAWLVGLGKQGDSLPIYTNLKKHFERSLNREGKTEKKVSSLPKPKLAIGKYKNPATNETVEKIKRNPRLLDEWIAEFGLPVVRTWKV